MPTPTTFIEKWSGTEKTADISDEEMNRQVTLMLSIAHQLGYTKRPTDRVLDLGCGIGRTVEALIKRGFDAYGVDVGEWWGRDYDRYWHDGEIPKPEISSRLSVVPEKSYRFPFPDHHFDLIISSQVFEHVFNYVDVFRELVRVLKPGGFSVHVFPGRGCPLEPHLGVPFIPLAEKDWWLRLWALRKRHRPTWRSEYEFLSRSMRTNNYPTKRQLRAYAEAAGAQLSFREDLYIEAGKSRPWRWIEASERFGMGWLIRPLVHRICQRTMLVSAVR